MLKPSVGEITDISSPLNFFSIVVFPALSKPLSLTNSSENNFKKSLKSALNKSRDGDHNFINQQMLRERIQY